MVCSKTNHMIGIRNKANMRLAPKHSMLTNGDYSISKYGSTLHIWPVGNNI